MDRPKNASNADRRSGAERREFLYAIHIPERRSGKDRRSGVDRRAAPLAYRRDNERRRIFH